MSLREIGAALSRVFAPNQYSLPVMAGLLILGVVVVFIGSLFIYRQRAPLAHHLGTFCHHAAGLRPVPLGA